jgi:hypothetical protein
MGTRPLVRENESSVKVWCSPIGAPLVYGARCKSRGSGSIPEKGHSRILAISSAFVPVFARSFSST